MQHYGDIESRMPEMMRAFLPFAASGCSSDLLETARKFFGEAAHQVEGTLNNLEKVSEQVTDCANLRKREGQAVAAYLEGFNETR